MLDMIKLNRIRRLVKKIKMLGRPVRTMLGTSLAACAVDSPSIRSRAEPEESTE